MDDGRAAESGTLHAPSATPQHPKKLEAPQGAHPDSCFGSRPEAAIDLSRCFPGRSDVAFAPVCAIRRPGVDGVTPPATQIASRAKQKIPAAMLRSLARKAFRVTRKVERVAREARNLARKAKRPNRNASGPDAQGFPGRAQAKKPRAQGSLPLRAKQKALRVKPFGSPARLFALRVAPKGRGGGGRLHSTACKDVDQHARLAWHRVREGYKTESLAIGKRLRGLLAEFGVLVAIANKHARQLWAMLAHDLDYDPHACVKHPMAQRPASKQALTVAAMA